MDFSMLELRFVCNEMVNFFVEIDRKEIMGSRMISISDQDDLVTADFVLHKAVALFLQTNGTFRVLPVRVSLCRNAFVSISMLLRR